MKYEKRKIPENQWFSGIWWRLGDSNPRPHACEASRGDAPCRERSNQLKTIASQHFLEMVLLWLFPFLDFEPHA